MEMKMMHSTPALLRDTVEANRETLTSLINQASALRRGLEDLGALDDADRTAETIHSLTNLLNGEKDDNQHEFTSFESNHQGLAFSNLQEASAYCRELEKEYPNLNAMAKVDRTGDTDLYVVEVFEK